MKKIILIIIMLSFCFSVWGADSTRTRSELEALFTPTGVNYITAQDLRDLLASMFVIDSIMTVNDIDYEMLPGLFTLGGSGDLDGNDDIQSTDVLWLESYIKGDSTFTVAQYLTADINGDGFVNYWDLLILSQLSGESVPISLVDKMTAWNAVTKKIYNYGDKWYIDDYMIINSEWGLTTDRVFYGSTTGVNDLDSSDVYKLNKIVTYVDSITTDTDVIYLWKGGKRADITFTTP